jgi:HSP20 family protein
MAQLARDPHRAPVTWFDQMDRLFDEWLRREPFARERESAAEIIRVDERLDGDARIIRAELPGIDPAKDVELTVADGMLRITAERRSEVSSEDRDKGYLRRELRYGSYARALPLPEGVEADDISASYRDGILEIRVPNPKAVAPEPKKIAITSG